MKTEFPALDSFFQQNKPMLYRRKERIAPFDMVGEDIFYLKQGYARFYTISAEGNELTMHIFSPNSIFPILGTDSAKFNNYFVESLTPVEVYRAERIMLEQLLEKNPKANLEVAKQLRVFSESIVKKLEIKVFGNSYQQVIAAILNLAESFGQKDEGKIMISYWFTHQDIASITGLSRERVSVEMSILLKKKLITYNNHFIVIPKTELLKTEMGK